MQSWRQLETLRILKHENDIQHIQHDWILCFPCAQPTATTNGRSRAMLFSTSWSIWSRSGGKDPCSKESKTISNTDLPGIREAPRCGTYGTLFLLFPVHEVLPHLHTVYRLLTWHPCLSFNMRTEIAYSGMEGQLNIIFPTPLQRYPCSKPQKKQRQHCPWRMVFL